MKKFICAGFNQIPTTMFGVVIMGCTLANDDEGATWINGITNLLKQKDVIDPQLEVDEIWQQFYSVVAQDGRRDLVFVGNSAKFNVGKFAIVRLQMPNCLWIEDWARIHGPEFAGG